MFIIIRESYICYSECRSLSQNICVCVNERQQVKELCRGALWSALHLMEVCMEAPNILLSLTVTSLHDNYILGCGCDGDSACHAVRAWNRSADNQLHWPANHQSGLRTLHLRTCKLLITEKKIQRTIHSNLSLCVAGQCLIDKHIALPHWPSVSSIVELYRKSGVFICTELHCFMFLFSFFF